MKACGIVVEYNPLHNGHLYHLNKSKELSKSDIIIGVMSPNFVQRGEPSIVSKKERVQAALKAGVNIVVELPTLYAVENANIFAKYALQILNGLNVTKTIYVDGAGTFYVDLSFYVDCRTRYSYFLSASRRSCFIFWRRSTGETISTALRYCSAQYSMASGLTFAVILYFSPCS